MRQRPLGRIFAKTVEIEMEKSLHRNTMKEKKNNQLAAVVPLRIDFAEQKRSEQYMGNGKTFPIKIQTLPQGMEVSIYRFLFL